MKQPPQRHSRRAGRTPGGKRAFPWAVIVPGLVALLAYLPTLRDGFVWDDVTFVVRNPAAHDLARLPESLAHGYGWVPSGTPAPDARYYFRPVVTSWNAIQGVWTDHPALFHLANVLAHAMATWLLAWLALQLGLAPGTALLLASLFAVHPAYSEAVAWISGRTDLFAALFGLACLAQLAAWRAGRLPPWLGRSVPWGAGVALLLALGSKESAVAVVAAGAILLSLSPPGPAATRSRARAAAVLGAAMAIYLALRWVVLPGGGLGAVAEIAGRGGFAHRLLLSGDLFAAYLLRLVLPRDLATEAPSWLSGGSVPGWPAVLGLILLAAAGGGWLWLWSRAWRSRDRIAPAGPGTVRHPRREGKGPAPPEGSEVRPGSARRTALVLGLGLFLAGLLPVLQWIPTGEVYGERFLYLPAAGLFLAAGALLDGRLRGRPGRVAGLLLLPGAAYLVLLEAHLPVWRDELTLFESTVRARPASARALAQYGSALLQRGRTAQAEGPLERAVTLDPDDPWKQAQYGSLLVELGRPREGIPHLERARASGPPSSSVFKNLGIAWTRLGECDRALEALEEARKLSPADLTVTEAIADAQRRAGHLDRAEELLLECIRRDPGRKRNYLNLIGLLYYDRRDPDAARVWITRFLDRFPSAPESGSVRLLLGHTPDTANPTPQP